MKIFFMSQFIETIEYEISHFDYLLILHVKELRDKKKWSQKELSIKMGVSSSFVGNVESLNERHKYSTRHIALLTNAFGYKSSSKLLSFPLPKYDLVKLVIDVTKENFSVVKNGTEVKKIRVVSSVVKEIIPTKYFK